MNGKNSGFGVVLMAVVFVGLLLTIMQGVRSSGRGFGSRAAVAKVPGADVPTVTPLALPIAVPTQIAVRLDEPTVMPTIEPTAMVFEFEEVVPVADSPEAAADEMQACFSAFSRMKNEAEGRCLGEWYPVDMAPRDYDQFWCASDGAGVRWVPVRLYDGRAGSVVVPFGKPESC